MSFFMRRRRADLRDVVAADDSRRMHAQLHHGSSFVRLEHEIFVDGICGEGSRQRRDFVFGHVCRNSVHVLILVTDVAAQSADRASNFVIRLRRANDDALHSVLRLRLYCWTKQTDE